MTELTHSEIIYSAEALATMKLDELETIAKARSCSPRLKDSRAKKESWIKVILEDQQEYGVWRKLKVSEVEPGMVLMHGGLFEFRGWTESTKEALLYDLITGKTEKSDLWFYRQLAEPVNLVQTHKQYTVGQILWQRVSGTKALLRGIRVGEHGIYWYVSLCSRDTYRNFSLQKFEEFYEPYTNQADKRGQYDDIEIWFSNTIRITGYLSATERHLSVGQHPYVDVTQNFNPGANTWTPTTVKVDVRTNSQERTLDYITKLQVAKSLQELCDREPSNQIVYETLQEQGIEHE